MRRKAAPAPQPDLTQWQQDEINSLLTATHSADRADYPDVDRPRRHGPVDLTCDECVRISKIIKELVRR